MTNADSPPFVKKCLYTARHYHSLLINSQREQNFNNLKLLDHKMTVNAIKNMI